MHKNQFRSLQESIQDFLSGKKSTPDDERCLPCEAKARELSERALNELSPYDPPDKNMITLNARPEMDMQIAPRSSDANDDARTLCREMQRTWRKWGEGTHPDDMCDQMNYYYTQLCNAGYDGNDENGNPDGSFNFCNQNCVTQADRYDWQKFCKDHMQI